MFEGDFIDDADFFAPPLTDEEIAVLIASDPEPPDPELVAASQRERVAKLLAAGQSAPMDDVLAGQLGGLDPATLDQEQRLALTVGLQRVANRTDALRGRVVAAFTADAVAVFDLHPRAVAAADVGAALALGRGAADTLVETSVALADRLADTDVVARRGDLSWDKATTLATQTATLTDQQASQVEAQVLPAAVKRTPAQHRDAVRRAVDRIDPDGADDRRRQAEKDVALIRTHHGDGIGELFARMPSEQLDTVWTGADAWARRATADGDPRTLDQLRVAALVAWAESFLTHGDPTYCDTYGQPSLPDEEGPTDDGPNDNGSDGAGPRAGPPRRHGRPVRVGVIWDLTSLLGLTRHCGELLDSGATLPPDAMTELLARGVRIRRMLIDPDSGELVDLTPRTWRLPSPEESSGHGPPVTLGVILDTRLHTALTTGDLTDLDQTTVELVQQISVALDAAHPALRELVAYPVTADTLDDHPHAETPTPALAEFVALRDRHPTTPPAATCRSERRRGGDVWRCSERGTSERCAASRKATSERPHRRHPPVAHPQNPRHLDRPPPRPRLAMDQPHRSHLHHPALRLPPRPVGQPAGAGFRATSVVGSLDPEADLHLHLEVRDLAIGDVAADRRHLEPVEVAHRLRCARDTVADRLVHAVRAGAHDLGDAICVVGHWSSLSCVGTR